MKKQSVLDQVFFGNFDNEEDVFREFAVSEEDRKGIKFIYARYDTPSYEGDAFVIFKKNRKLYEVNGSHCSCYGLESCWEPEETSFKALMARPNVDPDAKANLQKLYGN